MLSAAAASAEAAEQTLLVDKVKTLVTLRALLTPEQNELLSKWLDRTLIAWKPRPVIQQAPTPVPTDH
jgi:Spy/CpxP family protein refolding chaperone